MPRTIVQKILDAHRVHEEGGRSLVYIDRIIMADTALPALRTIKRDGYAIRRPDQAVMISDHFVPSASDKSTDAADMEKFALIRDTESAARDMQVDVFGLGDNRRGIQHIVSVEQAYAQPGITLSAADSHTSTQGAVGALAFSVGTDVPHLLATQCTWLKPPRMMRVKLDGSLATGVTAKDVALALVAIVGPSGASGHAVEYAGSFVSALSIDGRMSICNLSAEMGAQMSIIAPDEITFAYLRGRAFAPTGSQWDEAERFWRSLSSDPDATFERELSLDVSDLEPMVTWGNSTADAIPISGNVPDPSLEPNADKRAQMRASLDYMGLEPATPLAGLPIDQVFIGSCSNSRIEDLRAAAQLMRGARVSVPTLVVPGSGMVKEQAEAEGLDTVFRSAGASWGEAGCSLCVSMNGDIVAPGSRCASTSNRNHIGRQGRGSRTHLVSPPMAAAAAVAGRLVDVRTLGVA